MIIDLAQQSFEMPKNRFDVCIVGGGVAGIILAIRLGRAGRSVLLAEAGGIGVNAASQELYRGGQGGLENLPLDETRIRALGGSSHHWGGWCRPLDAHDFQRTDLQGGWPIAKADLDPYFREAATMLGVTELSGLDTQLSGGQLQTIRMYFSRPPANLAVAFIDELRGSSQITALLNAACAQVKLDQTAPRVASVRLVTGSEVALECYAREFILAMGAVENVRQLLVLRQRNAARLANMSDSLGRFYMQHMHQVLGQFVLFDANAPALGGQSPVAFLATTEAYLRARGRGAFRLYSTGIACAGIVDDFQKTVVTCRAAAASGTVLITAEQIPTADSRILLTDETDRLGLPPPHLDWQISEDDHEALRQAAYTLGRYLIEADIGRLQVNPAILGNDDPLAGWTRLGGAPGAAGHQMGGARMSSQAQDGIVDQDCRVWGLHNLSVAGSAVFRNSGHATPTLTIAQLALRLADTIDRRLKA